MDRREFLRGGGTVAATAVTAAVMANATIAAPNDRITVCVMGVRWRGGGLLDTFASLTDVDVKYVCDIDDDVLGARVSRVADKTGRRPMGIADGHL